MLGSGSMIGMQKIPGDTKDGTVQGEPWSCAWSLEELRRTGCSPSWTWLNTNALERSPPPDQIQVRDDDRLTIYKPKQEALVSTSLIEQLCLALENGHKDVRLNHWGFSQINQGAFYFDNKRWAGAHWWALTLLLASLSSLFFQGGRWSWKLSALRPWASSVREQWTL